MNTNLVQFNPDAERVAVILDRKEHKIEKAFKMLRTLHGDKVGIFVLVKMDIGCNRKI